jgi:hypothetical protein
LASGAEDAALLDDTGQHRHGLVVTPTDRFVVGTDLQEITGSAGKEERDVASQARSWVA